MIVLLLAVWGAQCFMKDGSPGFGCFTGPYQGGVAQCNGKPGAPDVAAMER